MRIIKKILALIFHPLSPVGIVCGVFIFAYVTGIDINVLISDGVKAEKFYLGGTWFIYSLLYWRVVYHRAIVHKNHMDDMRKRHRKISQKKLDSQKKS